MRLFIILLLAGISLHSGAQQTLAVKITSGAARNPLATSILIKGTGKGYATDTAGIASIFFPANGIYTLVVSATGYGEIEKKILIPYQHDTIAIEMETAEEELDEVIVQSTRTSRTIANVPTRVETIELEEIDEKNNMRPANVAMLLHESTGIQVQQTSATSGNASIRIQGLDGRYTQLLKDGFANFGAFSSGLSVLEIPPLDLKQVEIIKGPVSPLFGGGAIAGVVNFISKTPKSKPEYSFILNQSHIGQSNIGGFAAGRGKKAGYTLLAVYNRQKSYDADKDGFTEVPRTQEYTVHPKLFLYPSEHTTITIGNSFTKGERTGGDMQVINDKADAAHQYFETNNTTRNNSTFELDKKIGDKKRVVAKQSFSVFDRSIASPSYAFAGVDHSAFTDIAYITNAAKHALVIGSNFNYNRFKEKSRTGNKRDNTAASGGLYGQHTWDAAEKIKLESGLRLDVANYKNAVYTNTEIFLLPRISLLVKYDSRWSSRIGAGMGYKTPTLLPKKQKRFNTGT